MPARSIKNQQNRKKKARTGTAGSKPLSPQTDATNILGSIGVGIILLDKDLRVAYLNPAAASFLRKPERELIGEPLEEIVPESVQEKLFREMSIALEEKTGFIIEEFFPDPMNLWLDCRCRFSEGGLIVELQDITERKQAEDALHKSEFRFHTLFETMTEGVAIHEILYDGKGFPMDYVILDINPAYTAHTGIERHDAVGKRATEVYKVGVPPYLEIFAQVASRGSRVRFETYFEPMGKYFDVSVFSPYKGRFATVFNDITESKRAEKALKISLAKYQVLFEMFPLGITITDKHGNIVETNRQSANLLGISKQEHMSRKIDDRKWRIIRTDGAPMTPDEYASTRALKENRVIENAEMGIVGDEGNTRWINVTAAPIPLEGFGVAVTYGDITKRRQAEESLKESQRALTTLMGNLPGMAYRCRNDREWTMEFVSEGSHALTGYRPGELIGNSKAAYGDLIHPDDRENVWDTIQESLRLHEPFQITYRIVTAEGRLKWVWEKGIGILSPQGEIVALEGFISDITDLKRAEYALKESEEKFSRIFRLSPEMITISRISDGTFIDVNDAFEQNTGISRKEAIGRSSVDLGIWRSARERSQALQGIGKHAGAAIKREVNMHRKDGTMFNAVFSAVEVDIQGEKLMLLIIRDVTDLKQAEKKLITYRDHLEKLVIERTRELEEKNRKLGEEIAERKKAEEEKQNIEAQLLQSQKIEALGSFAGGIAHDLNNILYPIVINTETLFDETAPGTEAHEMLKQTLDCAYRQRDLVKQILSFSRQDVQKLSPIRITPFLERTLDFIRSTLPSTIEIRCSINAPVDMIMGDSTQIQQVIMNLCKNAADAMESQKGTIEVSMTDVHLDEDPVHPEIKQGEYLELIFQDTGHGIPAEIIDRIFDPFFTTKSVGKGSGLGLSVVHGIVKKHGGTIAAESKEGQGTRITVRLPLLDRKLSDRASGGGDRDAARKKILLVDDEDIIVTALARAMERMGYEVVALKDAFEAIQLFRRSPDAFDLVVTDMTMPGMTGVELGKKIMEIRPSTPVILCTGYSDIIDKQEARDMGFSSLIMKPAGAGELKSTIQQALES